VTANTAENIEKSAPRDVADASVLSAVNWDDSKMVTHFANVVNIQSTLEQVDLFFGTNQTWNVPSDRRVQVELNNRIILSPHAAKRLCSLSAAFWKATKTATVSFGSKADRRNAQSVELRHSTATGLSVAGEVVVFL
jgi:Protein of unknown function (DUF3467)